MKYHFRGGAAYNETQNFSFLWIRSLLSSNQAAAHYTRRAREATTNRIIFYANCPVTHKFPTLYVNVLAARWPGSFARFISDATPVLHFAYIYIYTPFFSSISFARRVRRRSSLFLYVSQFIELFRNARVVVLSLLFHLFASPLLMWIERARTKKKKEKL